MLGKSIDTKERAMYTAGRFTERVGRNSSGGLMAGLLRESNDPNFA